MQLEQRGPHEEHVAESQKMRMHRMIDACKRRNADPEELVLFLEETIEQADPKDTATLTKLYRQLMEAFDLPWEIEAGRSMLYDVTMVNEKGSDDPEAPRNPEIANFFATIADLELAHQGSAQFLFKTYGIRAFHRYGSTFLGMQYQESSLNQPYGVILTSYRDDGDGFTRLHRELQDIVDQLPPNVSMRIIEAKDALEATRLLTAQRKRFSDQPFRFGLVETHGHDGEHIVLGVDHTDDRETGIPGAIRREHLKGSGAKRIGSYFSPDAPIVLMGCKSGKPGGIAEALENAIQRPIIAAEGNTTFAEITFASWSPQSVPSIDVTYYRNNTPVPTRRQKSSAK